MLLQLMTENTSSCVGMAAQNVVQRETEQKTEITYRSAPMTGGFLEMSSSRVHAEYIEHLGKPSGDGPHICVRAAERRTQWMCLDPCHKSLSVQQTGPPARPLHSEATSPSGGGEASQCGSWNQEK